MKDLVELCELIIPYLEKLYNEGRITKEEYERHIKVKMDFLNKQKGGV